MTGILPINKPQGFTSFDVVAKVRGMTKTKKIGHSGTLDPMATGVLLLFLENSTKAISVLPNEDKEYIADIQFGLKTDTQDITGNILSISHKKITENDFCNIFKSFIGIQKQLPPMFSAKKVDGVPLYDMARKGITVERQPKDIQIYSIDLISMDEEAQKAEIKVSCGKGTFIRTLINDMGEKLGCYATMTKLVRTKATGFNLSECFTLDEVQNLCNEEKMNDALVSPERLFKGLPKITLSDYDKHLYENGVHLSLSKRDLKGINGNIAVYDKDENLLGISVMDELADELKLLKLL